jgi:hypothetical protein
VLYLTSPSQLFQPAVFEAQRRYEALVFLTQGYVRNPGPAPASDRFHVEQPDAHYNVRVTDSFATAPLVGYFGRLPVDLTVDFDESTHRFSVTVTLPSAAVDRKGHVLKLVWPNGKTLIASELITWPKRSQHRRFDLLTPEGLYDTIIDISNLIEEEPLEVWIGGMEMADDDFSWENNVLSIRVPNEVEAGHLLVITRAGVYKSNTHFRPTGLPTNDNGVRARVSRRREPKS